jgi:hypothetical protein
MALDQFAVTFRVAAADGGHGGFILPRALALNAGHVGLHHTPERHRQRRIVTLSGGITARPNIFRLLLGMERKNHAA